MRGSKAEQVQAVASLWSELHARFFFSAGCAKPSQG
jgi:hypothetical protein